MKPQSLLIQSPTTDAVTGIPAHFNPGLSGACLVMELKGE
jgi:hypothetical protein